MKIIIKILIYTVKKFFFNPRTNRNIFYSINLIDFLRSDTEIDPLKFNGSLWITKMKLVLLYCFDIFKRYEGLLWISITEVFLNYNVLSIS